MNAEPPTSPSTDGKAIEHFEFYLLSMRELMVRLRLAAEQHERDVLAGELHDYLAQQLLAARIKLELLARDMDSSEVRDTIDTVLQFVNDSLQYTRTLIADLSPQVLFESGIVPATESLARRMKQHELTVRVSEAGHSREMSRESAVQLYRMIRESLFNVVKHAETDCAECRFAWGRESIRVEIEDRGRGFEVGSKLLMSNGDHYGVASIAKRVKELNGSFDIASEPGAGCTVRISLPYSSAENDLLDRLAL